MRDDKVRAVDNIFTKIEYIQVYGPRAVHLAAHHAPATASSSAASAWRLNLGELAVEQGRVSFSDRAGTPVALDLVDLAVQLAWNFHNDRKLLQMELLDWRTSES